MKVDYKNMKKEQLDLINEYCEDNLRKLKQICKLVWGKKQFQTCYHDDLYDDAIKVLSESVMTFNPNEKVKFKTYLTNNIRLSYKEWCRDNFYRAKRNNLLLDENGKIVKDEEGNPVIVNNVSFDATFGEDEVSLADCIADSYDLEDEIFGSDDVEFENRIELYLQSLPKISRAIINMRMENIDVSAIKKTLNLTDAQYTNYINEAKEYTYIRLLHINNYI